MKIIAFLAIVVLAAMAYIRLAPSDAGRWHVAPTVTDVGDAAGDNSFRAVRQITASPETILRSVEQVMLQQPGTSVFAGSQSSGLITFITRSKIMGYPDYTTVGVIETDAGPLLSIFARSRFGNNDHGVNAARVQAVLARLGPLVVTPT